MRGCLQAEMPRHGNTQELLDLLMWQKADMWLNPRSHAAHYTQLRFGLDTQQIRLLTSLWTVQLACFDHDADSEFYVAYDTVIQGGAGLGFHNTYPAFFRRLENSAFNQTFKSSINRLRALSGNRFEPEIDVELSGILKDRL